MSDAVGMNRFYAIFASLALSAGPTAMAQPATAPAAPAPVERATADAVARLYSQLAAERVDGLPLSEIVERVGGREAILDGLSRAQQIGGPREVADGVVQVNLEISGDVAAAMIVRVVDAAPAKSPIAARRLSTALASWKDRTFTSTGDNVDVAMREVDAVKQGRPIVAQTQAVRLALPDLPPVWTRDAQTMSAIAPSAGSQLRTARAAEKSARAALREQLGRLAINEHTVLGAAGEDAQSAIDLVVVAARISSVDYRADGSVKVDVSIDGQQLWQTLQITAGR